MLPSDTRAAPLPKQWGGNGLERGMVPEIMAAWATQLSAGFGKRGHEQTNQPVEIGLPKCNLSLK